MISKITKIFIHVILFYDDNVCLGFGRWFFGHLLLKIIFSMKRCYMGFGGFVGKCGVCVCTFLKWLKFEKYICEKVSWLTGRKRGEDANTKI